MHILWTQKRSPSATKTRVVTSDSVSLVLDDGSVVDLSPIVQELEVSARVGSVAVLSLKTPMFEIDAE